MFESFISQLRSNARLRWGVLLIVGIFWLYGVLVLNEMLQEKMQQQRATASSVARLREQLTHTEWTTRVTPIKVIAVQLEGRLWQAPTAGLAQAAFQDFINTALLKGGVTNPQVSVAVVDDALTAPTVNPGPTAVNAASPSAQQAPSDIWKVRAKISFELGTSNPSTLLALIESNDKQIVVGSISIRKEPAPRGDLELYAYFQKPASSANPANTANTANTATSAGAASLTNSTPQPPRASAP